MSDLVVAPASGAVVETVERLRAALDRRSITVFAVIDHGAAARQVGLELPDETLLVFGNPQAGTPLMQADPTVGIELPLKILVWDDHDQTKLGYQDLVQLAQGYSLAEVSAQLELMRMLLAELAAEAA